MNNEMIRSKLHQLIDQIDHNESLQKLYTDALELKYSFMEEDPFTEELWAEIDQGLAQIRNGEPCTHVAAIEKFLEWERRK